VFIIKITSNVYNYVYMNVDIYQTLSERCFTSVFGRRIFHYLCLIHGWLWRQTVYAIWVSRLHQPLNSAFHPSI